MKSLMPSFIAEQKRLAEDVYHDLDLIYCTSLGNFIDHDIRFHDLRYTHATLHLKQTFIRRFSRSTLAMPIHE
ncbi:hypothetical protein [Brevibacillus formosus]|uniref:hypothetical protein n=1 Tax=Brevibacillus formosus TaxID=54913 RepID=UPI003D1EAD49